MRKAVEPEIAQRQLVALVILAEAAGAAGPCGHVDITIRDRLAAEALRLRVQIVGEIAGGEAGWATLPNIGKLATAHEIVFGGGRKRAGAVAQVLENGLNHAFGAPMQAAVKYLDLGSICSQERPWRIGPVGCS